jgi:hypothetical protein
MYSSLQHKNRLEWNSEVTLLYGDMRVISLPQKVDILVSELLGSFGDNELSPECLDGAARFLKGTKRVGYCLRIAERLVRGWYINSLFLHRTYRSDIVLEALCRSQDSAGGNERN